jgi:hypothetical protein
LPGGVPPSASAPTCRPPRPPWPGPPPEQAAGPATRRRPVRAVDLHRDDLPAGAALGSGLGGPL